MRLKQLGTGVTSTWSRDDNVLYYSLSANWALPKSVADITTGLSRSLSQHWEFFADTAPGTPGENCHKPPIPQFPIETLTSDSSEPSHLIKESLDTALTFLLSSFTFQNCIQNHYFGVTESVSRALVGTEMETPSVSCPERWVIWIASYMRKSLGSWSL